MARLDPSGSSRLLGQENIQTARLMVYLLLCIVLMAMDQRGAYVSQIRGWASMAMEPVFHVVDWPSSVIRSIRTYSRSFNQLLDENQQLARALLRQKGATQRLEALDHENQRLRALLTATAGRKFEYRFAEMVQVNLDPYAHQVMIDQGASAGVFEGQAVIDGLGVMGQVESVLLHMSTVRLISDPDHALPVQLERTGLRTVAFGTGSNRALSLPNVPLQADVREGDLLLTSGLGERFPSGFPVATVALVERREGDPFLRVTARPLAALDRGLEVLLVIPAETSAPPTTAAVRPVQEETMEERIEEQQP